MAQDLDQDAAPSGPSGVATHSRDNTQGEDQRFPEISLRPERADDAGFLATLFRSSALPDLALLPVDDGMKESLLRMQFASQTATYRSEYPHARFEIIEHGGKPIGRLVVDAGDEAGCIVDLALLAECRGGGLGTAILAAAVAPFARLKRPVLCKVLARNEASLRMCRRVGFVQIDSIPPFLQLEWRPPDVDAS